VTGGTVNLDVAGDITAGTAAGGGNNNNIIADELVLDADGSVGTKDERLVSDTDEITINANDLYLDNNSGELEINHIKTKATADISAAGNVTDSGGGKNITSLNLNIDAYGNIGDSQGNPLEILVPENGSYTAGSDYGLVNLNNVFKPDGGGDSSGGGGGGGGGVTPPEPVIINLGDPKTGVTVSGKGIDKGAKIVVTEETEHKEDACPACAYIRELINTGKAIANYDISLTKAFTGMVKVSIPVDPKYEGQTLTILYCQDGIMNSFDAKVKDGMVSFETDTLNAYAVLNHKYSIMPYNGPYTIIDGKKVPMAETRFKDVRPADWYFAAIAYVHALKILVGVTQDRFDPQGITTRAMLVAVLYRLEGNPHTAGNTSFTDVEPGAWYTDAVNWAQEKGIVQGYGNNLFGTNDPVTREQLVVILYNYTRGKGKDVSASRDLSGFTDASQVSGFATDAMKWAVALGLIKGKGNHNIDPTAFATRAEISAIMQLYLERYTEILLLKQ